MIPPPASPRSREEVIVQAEVVEAGLREEARRLRLLGYRNESHRMEAYAAAVADLLALVQPPQEPETRTLEWLSRQLQFVMAGHVEGDIAINMDRLIRWKAVIDSGRSASPP